MAGDSLPSSWADALVRSVIVWVVAFATLNLKEYLETKSLDASQVAIDASWIGGGFLIVNALLMLLMPKKR